jgi:hypothetical protein
MSGLNMTGQYVGETNKKVEEWLNKVNGGVLFIDAAYELGKGQFGDEACSTLVATITNLQWCQGERGIDVLFATELTSLTINIRLSLRLIVMKTFCHSLLKKI